MTEAQTVQDVRRLVESTLVPHTAFAEALARVKQCLAYSERSPEPICLAIVGESRTGKSRVLEEAELAAPRSRVGEGAVVPILRVSAPSKPTVKGLAELMLHELGDPKWEVGTENNKTLRLKKLMGAAQTRMLMVDEFQHFFDKSTCKVFHHVADWLKILADSTKVALVVTGLESSLPVLLRNEQLSGRFLAPVFMRRFHWLEEEHRAEYAGILAAFSESLASHFDAPALAEEDMAFRCWCATGGLIGYTTKLLRQCVWDACDEGRRTIALKHLKAAHERAIWPTAAGAANGPSPFSRAFDATPTQEMIARTLAIGVRDDAPAPSRGRGTHHISVPKTATQALRASGA